MVHQVENFLLIFIAPYKQFALREKYRSAGENGSVEAFHHPHNLSFYQVEQEDEIRCSGFCIMLLAMQVFSPWTMRNLQLVNRAAFTSNAPSHTSSISNILWIFLVQFLWSIRICLLISLSHLLFQSPCPLCIFDSNFTPSNSCLQVKLKPYICYPAPYLICTCL